jgi:hypothetical protein
MRRADDGEGRVKAAGEVYLPKPSGFKAMPDGGTAMYDAYKARARFPEIVAPTLAAMVGVIHDKDIAIEMPNGLNYLKERATKTGLSLDAFHRRVTSALLKLGRYSVLADAPSEGGEPFLCGYAGDAVINWDDTGTFYVIDDSGQVRKGFTWDREDRFVELVLEEGRYVQRVHVGGAATDITPTRSGGGTMDRIPFVVANSKDIAPDIQSPPMIGVARAAIAVYQLSADYRHQLFMSGQETLVAINGDAPKQIGAGVVHQMDGTDGVTPDLKYVSPSCAGIEAHKIAMDDETDAAVRAGAKLLEQDGGAQESGKARQLRTASNNSVLASIAKVSCEVLEKSLRNAAMMMGLDQATQEQITVTPPKDLGDTTMSAQDAYALVQAWQLGGFSTRTLYENLQRGGIANPERAFEDELAEPEGFGADFDEQQLNTAA